MRIVHTCLRYPPATGGVEAYVEQLVQRTRSLEQQRDVRVLTSKLRTHHPISELNPNLLLDDPMYVQRLHHASTPFIAYPRLQALKYYIGHHQPDIIHGHSFWYQPADVAANYAAQHNLPFIFHPYFYQHGVRQKLIWQLYMRTIGRRTFAAADVVVVISPFEQDQITKAGFPVNRFALIPPGVDADKYQLPQPNPYPAHSLDGPVILTVGRLSPGKGLDQVIAALPAIIKQVPDTKLAIVGEDFGAKPALVKQVKQLGVKSHVRFLGKLTSDELIAAYQHATVLLHPSHYEAFGMVLAESLAAGTPVIARDKFSIPYVAPHDRAGLLFQNDQTMIQHTIGLLTNVKLNTKLGRQGQQHVQQNFSWQQSTDKLLKLYDELT